MERETGEHEKPTTYTISSGDTTTVVKVGDCVLMKKRGSLDPTVGRVVSFNSDDPSNVSVTVNWYYRPEETPIGRRSYHGHNEVFSTVGSHREICSAVNIIEKCFVNKLSRSHPGSELHLPTGPAHYFWRFKFDHEEESLDMSQVDRYCFCRMPMNPDVKMVQCGRCNEWYHPACLERRPPTGKDFQNRMICSKNCCSVPTTYTISFGGKKTVVKAGDCVLMKNRGSLDPSQRRVGRVVGFNSNNRVTVNWYYRPEETPQGRKSYHGRYEIFSTVRSHREICSAVDIVGKCFVKKLKRSHPGSELHLPTGPNTHYFWRFKFDHEEESLDMSQVDRYCFCRMPMNPDVKMVQCGRCNEWYHPACLEGRRVNFQNRMICSKECCARKRGSGKRH